MPSVLELVKQYDHHEIRRFGPGETIIKEGEYGGRLFFLIEGSVEQRRDDALICVASRPGTVFGELAILLEKKHLTTVQAITPCLLYAVSNPRGLLTTSPAVCLHVCETLARRLDALIHYLTDVKSQFDGENHLSMVGEILVTLMHREPHLRIRPRESGIHHGQAPD